MKGRIKPRLPRNDALILRLLEEGRIVVSEDYDDLILHQGEMKPRTKILVRDERNGTLREKRAHPGLDGSPYLNIYPEGRRGGMKRLSCRRVVWYAFNPQKTGLMVCPVDGDISNFNIWNLCLRDQNGQNYMREMNRHRRPDIHAETPDGGDIPF